MWLCMSSRFQRFCTSISSTSHPLAEPLRHGGHYLPKGVLSVSHTRMRSFWKCAPGAAQRHSKELSAAGSLAINRTLPHPISFTTMPRFGLSSSVIHYSTHPNSMRLAVATLSVSSHYLTPVCLYCTFESCNILSYHNVVLEQ